KAVSDVGVAVLGSDREGRPCSADPCRTLPLEESACGLVVDESIRVGWRDVAVVLLVRVAPHEDVAPELSAVEGPLSAQRDMPQLRLKEVAGRVVESSINIQVALGKRAGLEQFIVCIHHGERDVAGVAPSPQVAEDHARACTGGFTPTTFVR